MPFVLLDLNWEQTTLTAKPPSLMSPLLHMLKPSKRNAFTDILINKPLYRPNTNGRALFRVGRACGELASADCTTLCN